MKNSARKAGLPILILLGTLTVTAAVQARVSKPEPTQRWYKIGKSVHGKAAHLSRRSRDRYCTQVCMKAGARKAASIGACKEGCVF
jgi:hypothetical protein